jgi:hypothetical protein
LIFATTRYPGMFGAWITSQSMPASNRKIPNNFQGAIMLHPVSRRLAGSGGESLKNRGNLAQQVQQVLKD